MRQFQGSLGPIPDLQPKPVLKRATKKRAPWDAELVLIVLALCMLAAITAVVLDGAGLLR